MPYDGAGATTNFVVGPTKSLIETLYDWAVGVPMVTTITFPCPAASRMRVSINLTMSLPDVARINLRARIYGAETDASTAYRLLDEFIVYGTDADDINFEVVRSEVYQVAYTSMRVLLQSYGTVYPLFPAGGYVQAALLTF